MTHETTAAKPLSWKEHLWMALLVALLLLISMFWARPASTAAPGNADTSQYIRREKKPVLSPALFVGQTARAYRIAQEIPDVLDQLYCYCECDRHLGHKSLLSCFTDDHGAG